MCVKVKSFSPRRCACASVFVSHSSDYGPFPLSGVGRVAALRGRRKDEIRASVSRTHTELCVRGCAVRRCDTVTRCVRAPPAVHARTVICGPHIRGAPQPQTPAPRARHTHAQRLPPPHGLRCTGARPGVSRTATHTPTRATPGARGRGRKRGNTPISFISMSRRCFSKAEGAARRARRLAMVAQEAGVRHAQRSAALKARGGMVGIFYRVVSLLRRCGTVRCQRLVSRS